MKFTKTGRADVHLIRTLGNDIENARKMRAGRRTRCRLTARGRFHRLLAIALLAVLHGAAGTKIVSASDLFSEINMASVVNSTTAQENANESVGSTPSTQSVRSVTGLARLLNDQGIDTKLDDAVLEISMADLLGERANQTSPPQKSEGDSLRLTVDASADRIVIDLQLKTFQGNATVPGERLLELLRHVSGQDGVTLNASKQSLSLSTNISNRTVRVSGLKDAASRLRNVAQSCEQFFPQPAKTIVSKSAEVPKKPIAKASSLVGTWSAKTSNSDAWAVRFALDNTFVMVHTRNGKNSISRGRYGAAAGQLTLKESSSVGLGGKLSWQSDNAFRWSIQDASGKTLTTLSFIKK